MYCSVTVMFLDDKMHTTYRATYNRCHPYRTQRGGNGDGRFLQSMPLSPAPLHSFLGGRIGPRKKEEEEEETAQLAHAASAPSFSLDVRSSLEENVGLSLSAWIHSCQIRTLYRCCIGTFCERRKDFSSANIFARQTLARLFCMISAEDYASYEVL